MFQKYGFGECEFEHIPKGMPNPGRDLGKKARLEELLKKTKQHERGTTGSEAADEDSDGRHGGDCDKEREGGSYV